MKTVYQASCGQECANVCGLYSEGIAHRRLKVYTKSVKKKEKYARNIARNCAGEYAYSICSLERVREYVIHYLNMRALNRAPLTRYICIFDISAVTGCMYPATIIHAVYT